MSAETQPCPVCGTAQPASARYPDKLCAPCAARAVSPEGRPLEFFNLSISGGYGARHADDRTAYEGHVCFVDGLRCWADEDYYGGITLRPDATA